MQNPLPSKKYGILFFFMLLVGYLSAQQVKGTIKDSAGAPLPYASIYVKNTTLGTATDAKGRYLFDLEEGHFLIVYSYLGFRSVEKEVDISDGEIVDIDIVLKENPTTLGEVQVVGNTRGLGKEIMTKVRQNRKEYLHQLKTYQCDTYTKLTLDRKLIKPTKSDTMLVKETTKLTKKEKEKAENHKKAVNKNREAFFAKNNLQLIETVSETYFKSPRTFREKIIAKHDYSSQNQGGFGVEVYSGTDDIAPVQGTPQNDKLVYAVGDPDFNFYRNNIDFPLVCSKPLLSPIAGNAGMSYKYDYKGAFVEDGHKVYKIEIIPRFKGDALFYGFMFIEDSTFAIKSVDLSINPAGMFNCDAFKVLQNYEMIEGKYSLPVRREVLYTIKEGKDHFLGSAHVRHINYQINPNLPKKTFGREVKTYALDAFDKDSLFWVNIRPITFKQEELKFIIKSDSLKEYYESPIYKHKQDSIFNHIGFWEVVLIGMGHKDSGKGYEVWLDPLLEQAHPLGIGGYRHSLSGGFSQEFENNHILFFSGTIDYGITNQDVKGSVGVGYTYWPKKFMKTYVEIGDIYNQINNYASVEALFSRGNYVRTKRFLISQKMEIVNGLFGLLTLVHSYQIPITDLKLSDWSGELFGELNAPKEFESYKKTEIKLRLQYRFHQKHYFVHNKKVIVGTDWPELYLEYRKGLKGLFGSEVDYDFIELGVKDYRKLGRLGYSNWGAKMGSFVNHRNLRFLEHKFFRGSDEYLFSNPINSFQLLGPTLNTRNEYLTANIIHHFDGTILNKIPVVRYLKLELAVGAGALLIRDINFAHVEVFGGLERKVRIFKQPFRFGLFAVTSDNSLENASFNLKLGASIFSGYSRKWDY